MDLNNKKMDWKDFTDNKLCIRIAPELNQYICEAEKNIESNGGCPQSKPIYIYGTDKNAARLFFQATSLRIRISGFVEKEYSKINTFYHKPIYMLHELQKNAVVLTVDEDTDIKNCAVCKNFMEFNNNINQNSIAIYGCGNVGRKLKKYLDLIGAKVNCYIETDSNKIGTVLDGIPVYGRDKLESFENDISVIAAGQYCHEINNIIQMTNDKLDRYYIPYSCLIELLEKPLEEGIIVDFRKNVRIKRYELFSLEEHYADKELILYGSDMDLIEQYAEIYDLLNFDKVIIAIDDEKLEVKERIVPIINIADVVYKDKFIILLQDKCKINRLEELALIGSKDFVMISHACPRNPYREATLDINLGYVYLSNDQYPGIHIYGENKEEDFKVVVLGESTSDSNRSYIKSWVELLYASYLGKGFTIYNCAMSGYSSGQELLKLMRDATLLNPDLIISYSGVNEAVQVKEHSVFAFNYLYNLFNDLAESSKKKLVTGVHNGADSCSKWLNNMRYMNAIAEIHGAKFYAFVQPILSNKNTYTIHEKKMLKMIATIYEDEVFEEWKIFKEKAAKMQESYSYIYDLTNIFDKKDVYMDFCHVYENGNEIIAASIWNIIKEDIITYME